MDLITMLKTMLDGMGGTCAIFFLTLLFALPLGMVVALLRMSKVKVISSITRAVISVLRGTPLMLQLIVFYYGPGLLTKGEFMLACEPAVYLTFIFNYACYFSEIFRGGIESIPTGQYEACKVLGMTKTETFFRVILLQVIKNVVPPISNEVITLVKDTSLARIITYNEIIFVAESYIRGSGILWPLLYSGVFYLVASGLLTILFNKIEKRLNFYKV